MSASQKHSLFTKKNKNKNKLKGIIIKMTSTILQNISQKLEQFLFKIILFSFAIYCPINFIKQLKIKLLLKFVSEFFCSQIFA